jgi:hypothetical protein
LLHPGDAPRVQHGGASVSRGPHTQVRAALSAPALGALLLAASASAQPSGIAPYRYDPPYGTAPLDQEKARVYQDQLRHDLPREPPADASEAARRQELRQELDRVDRLLQRRPPLERAETPRPPPPGPVTGSGGRPQPTQAEIDEKLATKGPREAPPPAPVRPVYDLFGERLQ